jgi:2-polyprenyl-6-methoxyphenol hydroxylase-like FAD-dependent oxidoreductase
VTTVDGAAEGPGCVIAGCGPAGAVLGLLLARAGIKVVVLEKHADFFRDFRGDTVHPPTLQVIDELGLLSQFFALPHQKVTMLKVVTDKGALPFVDFSGASGKFPFITYVPQWDFLTMITTEAASNPTFTLMMRTSATGVVEERGEIRGVRYLGPDGPGQILAPLTVAADGRDSVVRDSAGLVPKQQGAPVDLLWFQLPRKESDPNETFLRLTPGHVFPMLNRGSYWQAAYIIPKGANEALRSHDVDVFRTIIGRALPFLADRTDCIRSWDDVRFLQVQVNKLRRWYRPGLLCIGDSAHASSPVGGFGANLAVQDAVAAANVLTEPLRQGRVTVSQLAKVQSRRNLSTTVTHAMQAFVQRRAIVDHPTARDPSRSPAEHLPTQLDLDRTIEIPASRAMRVFGRFSHHLMANGLRTEHVHRGDHAV